MSDVSGFGKFVPGFEFLQNLAGQATSGMAQGLDKHLSNNLAQMPHLGSWVAPTFSVEDLEKRIGELKAVHFWLDQNAKALGATIQALEVQKMTLATLKTMNFSLGDVADALKVKTGADGVPNPPAAAPSPAPTPFAGLEIPPRTYGTQAAPEAPETAGEPEEAAAPPASSKKAAPRAARKTAAPAPAAAGGMVDPMQWWGALSQQFQSIAAHAMKDVAMSSAAADPAPAAKPANGRPARAPATRQGKAAAPPSAPRKARKPKAVTTPSSSPSPAQGTARQPFLGGDWPMPTAFFPGLQPETGRASQPAAAAAPKVGKASPSRPVAKKAPSTATRRAASPAKARGTSGRR